MKNIEQSKYDYWRGFRACLILVVAPLLLAIVVSCNWIINTLG